MLRIGKVQLVGGSTGLVCKLQKGTNRDVYTSPLSFAYVLAILTQGIFKQQQLAHGVASFVHVYGHRV